MRIIAVVNPIAGGGRAAEFAAHLADALRDAGHACDVAQTRPRGETAWLDEALVERDLLVVVGGDGAVRLAAASAARRGVPLWQAPFGTENLFAREWGMDRSPATLLRAIARGQVVATDLGRANGEVFTLMASIGLDAHVVHELAAARRGGISHLSYVAPLLRSLRGYAAQRLRVIADGTRIDDESPGFVMIANSRHYALRLNPLRRADCADGLLDVLWIPSAGVASILGWVARIAMGSHTDHSRVVEARAALIAVECDEPFLYQLDGDPPWAIPVGQGVDRLEATIAAGALRVLVGDGGGQAPGAARARVEDAS